MMHAVQTTSPATDLELNVAIEGMKVWIELEAENQKSGKDSESSA